MLAVFLLGLLEALLTTESCGEHTKPLLGPRWGCSKEGSDFREMHLLLLPRRRESMPAATETAW